MGRVEGWRCDVKTCEKGVLGHESIRAMTMGDKSYTLCNDCHSHFKSFIEECLEEGQPEFPNGEFGATPLEFTFDTATTLPMVTYTEGMTGANITFPSNTNTSPTGVSTGPNPIEFVDGVNFYLNGQIINTAPDTIVEGPPIELDLSNPPEWVGENVPLPEPNTGFNGGTGDDS